MISPEGLKFCLFVTRFMLGKFYPLLRKPARKTGYRKIEDFYLNFISGMDIDLVHLFLSLRVVQLSPNMRKLNLTTKDAPVQLFPSCLPSLLLFYWRRRFFCLGELRVHLYSLYLWYTHTCISFNARMHPGHGYIPTTNLSPVLLSKGLYQAFVYPNLCLILH